MDSYLDEEEKSPESGSSSWSRIIAFVAAFSGLLILLFKYIFPYDPCINLYREFTEKHSLEYPEGNRGYSISDFVYFSDSIKIKLDSASIEVLIKKNYNYELFERNIDKLKMLDNINKSRLMEVIATDSSLINKEYYTQYVMQPHDFYYKRDDVCEIKLGLSLITPKYISQTMPEEISFFLNSRIIKCKDFQKGYNDPSQPINIVSIFDCLLKDSLFRQELSALFAKYSKYFEIVPLGIDDANLFFETGEYKLPGIYKVIIDNLMKNYVSYIVKNPSKKYQIICQGYADPSMIGSSGIPYDKEGRYGSEGETLKLTNPDKGFPMGNVLNNNIQLSFARAYEGISYARDAFPEQGVLDKIDVSFLYVGEGVLSGDYKLSRKIVFKLVQIP